MGFRDRFLTPATARALVSWRIAIGVGVAVALRVADVSWLFSILGGLAVYVVLVLAAQPRAERRPSIDPFAVGEPWRQFVQRAQRAERRLRETVDAADDGPLKLRMLAIVDKLQQGLDETWRIARRGDEIDAAVRRLDAPALENKLASLEREQSAAPSDDLDAAIDSVRSQLESVERLQQQSTQTANTLRLAETRLDELVARAAEVSIGATDTDAYEHEIEDLVVELEALRLAVEETNRP